MGKPGYYLLSVLGVAGLVVIAIAEEVEARRKSKKRDENAVKQSW